MNITEQLPTNISLAMCAGIVAAASIIVDGLVKDGRITLQDGQTTLANVADDLRNDCCDATREIVHAMARDLDERATALSNVHR